MFVSGSSTLAIGNRTPGFTWSWLFYNDKWHGSSSALYFFNLFFMRMHYLSTIAHVRPLWNARAINDVSSFDNRSCAASGTPKQLFTCRLSTIARVRPRWNA